MAKMVSTHNFMSSPNTSMLVVYYTRKLANKRSSTPHLTPFMPSFFFSFFFSSSSFSFFFSVPPSEAGISNPSLGAQIPARRLKFQPRGSNLSLEAPTPASKLKSQSQVSNPCLQAQIPA